MAAISAKNVKALRDATGAGMMDAKRALTENDGDFEASAKWLRARNLGKAAQRADNDNAQGAVAVTLSPDGRSAALVELKSETDFGAKSPAFVALADDLATAVAAEGEGAVDSRKDAIDDLKVTLRENIELGQVVRFEAGPDSTLATYGHMQNGRGVNGVLVELTGATPDLAHEIAVHVAFGQPGYLTRDEVPADQVEAERAAAEAQTRLDGKPEAALPKIIQGRLTGWYKRVPGGVLLDQPFANDDKQSVNQVLGAARIVRFAQAVIGGT
jgi:elongation factor Ts